MLQLQANTVTRALHAAPGDFVELAARTGLAGPRTEHVIEHLVQHGIAAISEGRVHLAG